MKARGQAVSELVVGLLVFVSVLLFGIHFAELGWMGAKVHEAAASALWDSTAYRSYQLGTWYDSGREAVPRTQAQSARYGDWDGRASARSGNPQLVLTGAATLQTSCRTGGASYGLSRQAPPFGETSGIGCSASAEVDPLRIPRMFRERMAPTQLCSTGRLTAGDCGHLALLLGEDALQNGTDALECEVTEDSPVPCRNTAFYDVTRRTFNRSMGWTGRPEQFADDIVRGRPQRRITGFYLSFHGEESSFRESLPDGRWDASPMDAEVPVAGPVRVVHPYRLAYSSRRACAAGGYCFLGRYSCN